MANSILSFDFLKGYLGWQLAGLPFAIPYFLYRSKVEDKTVLEALFAPDMWSGNFIEMFIDNFWLWWMSIMTAY